MSLAKTLVGKGVAYLSMMQSEELLQMLCALLETCCSGQAQC